MLSYWVQETPYCGVCSKPNAESPGKSKADGLGMGPRIKEEPSVHPVCFVSAPAKVLVGPGVLPESAPDWGAGRAQRGLWRVNQSECPQGFGAKPCFLQSKYCSENNSWLTMRPWEPVIMKLERQIKISFVWFRKPQVITTLGHLSEGIIWDQAGLEWTGKPCHPCLSQFTSLDLTWSYMETENLRDWLIDGSLWHPVLGKREKP